jgi:hypothetical protein
MRFLQPDLRQHDRVGVRRRNAPVASSVFHVLFIHRQNLSAQGSGIGAIVIPAVDASMPMICAHLQYSAILYGKESHHE